MVMVVTKPAAVMMVEGDALLVAMGASLQQEHTLHRAPDAHPLLRRRLVTMSPVTIYYLGSATMARAPLEWYQRTD